MITSEGIVGFTVFARPRDFPRAAFVVRPWSVGAAPVWPFTRPMGGVPGGYHHVIACCCESLVDARQPFEGRLFPLDRQPDDDPSIVEVWL